MFREVKINLKFKFKINNMRHNTETLFNVIDSFNSQKKSVDKSINIFTHNNTITSAPIKTYMATENVVRSIRKFQGLTKDCAQMLINQYPCFSPFTLYSILSQETQQRMKITHSKTYGKNVQYYDTYLEALKNGALHGVLLKMAFQLNTCPALLARKVLEQYISSEKNLEDNVSRSELNKLLRDTTLIKDKTLAYELYLCVIYDDQYGPVANAFSSSIGEEYEVKLENYLKERNIPFYNEDHLRNKGYDKTPDCKLEVPIAVNGFVINWIESKAQFGSMDVHSKYMNEQYLSYWNRFGPGLVIYWFGFLDTITKSTDPKVIVMDHFPENITYMDPTSIRPLPKS